MELYSFTGWEAWVYALFVYIAWSAYNVSLFENTDSTLDEFLAVGQVLGTFWVLVLWLKSDQVHPLVQWTPTFILLICLTVTFHMKVIKQKLFKWETALFSIPVLLSLSLFWI